MLASGLALHLLHEHADGWWLRSALDDPDTTTQTLGAFWLRDRVNGRLWPALAYWVQWQGSMRTAFLVPRRAPDGWAWSAQTNRTDDIEFDMQIKMPA